MRIDEGSENLNFGPSASELSHYLATHRSPISETEMRRRIHESRKKSYQRLADIWIKPMKPVIDQTQAYEPTKELDYISYNTGEGTKIQILYPRFFTAENGKCLYESKTEVRCSLPDGRGQVKVTFSESKEPLAQAFAHRTLKSGVPTFLINELKSEGKLDEFLKRITPEQKSHLYSIATPYQFFNDGKNETCEGTVINGQMPGREMDDFYWHQLGGDILVNVEVILPNSDAHDFFHSLGQEMVKSIRVVGGPSETIITVAPKRQVEECNKGNGSACASAGQTLIQEGKKDEGNRYLQKSCDLNNAQGCYALGKSIVATFPNDQKKTELANQYYQKACEGKVSDACSILGAVHLQKHQFREAITELKTGCEGKIQASCYNLACAYSLTHEKQNALNTFETLLGLGYQNWNEIEKDQDLIYIKNESRFKQLIQSHKN